VDVLDGPGRAQAQAAVAEGLLEPDAMAGVHGRFGRCVLTRRGRLLADTLIRRLV
jgi:hypothetical protein